MFGLVKEKKLNELQKRYDELSKKIENYGKTEQRNLELSNEISILNRDLLFLKKQIREQTEADLFFVVSKIHKKLLEGEPKQNVQQDYLQVLKSYGNLQQMSSPSQSSFLEGLGLGQLFGGRY